MERVYCTDCTHLEGDSFRRMCGHPDNVYDDHSWLKVHKGYKREPKEINSENDCTSFMSNVIKLTSVSQGE